MLLIKIFHKGQKIIVELKICISYNEYALKLFMQHDKYASHFNHQVIRCNFYVL